MTREEAIELLRSWDGVYIGYSSDEVEEALEMAIKALNSLEEVYAKGYNDGFTQAEVNYENDKALSQVSEIKENIIKYMKKYPNHVGNTDFWEGFYACRNVVLQLDDEEYAPKEQEPCDDAISREAVLQAVSEGCQELRGVYGRCEELINALPSVTQKSGKWIITYPHGEPIYECPCCHASNSSVFKNYCPNCGARMESEDKE